jgi:hypothetical protein
MSMGVRILVGHEEGEYGYESEIASLFDSVTGWAFGPVFHRGEDGDSPGDLAQAFLDWLAEQADNNGRDPRQIPPDELEKLYGRWTEDS